MPGIAGIISQSPVEEFSHLVKVMVGAMKHENFYRSEICSVSGMGIYMGFVGFKESHDGIYSDPRGDIMLAYSGECLIGQEMVTARQIVDLYRENGAHFAEKLNGLFSGLLIDKQQRKAILFNDRYGMRRIYFHERDGAFYFASEAKALLRILPELREFNPEGVADYLAFGCTLDWRTLFRQIEILPGASLWTFEGARCRKDKYFRPENWEGRPEVPVAEYENLLPQTFKQIVPRYFGTSSKIGIALTGGLDTRMIMACRPLSNGCTTSYTFSGNNGMTLDDTIAARVAVASNLDHKLLRLDADFFSDFRQHADDTVFATDGCAGVCNSHEVYFNRKARELAPVRLTGNYGSEILRGISTFKPVPLSPQLFNEKWRPIIKSRATRLADHQTQPMTFAAFKEIPWNLYGNLSAGWSQLQFRTPYLDNDLVALAFQAPKSLRRSSGPCMRVVSANNASLCQIPTDRGYANGCSGLRFLGRRAFAEVTFKLDYYNNEGFPNALAPLEPLLKGVSSRLGLVGLHKFLHYRDWFQSDFASYVRDGVAAALPCLDGFFEPGFLKTVADEHIDKKKNHCLEINAILTLEAVDRLLFREIGQN
ncbi:MAG TPA: hypothetical protein VH280_19485 [Verrucomicrobiae bacterium]|jgi:asparagine synthase (glutamine-hydrolysing)|nr:hypothetical protein [Verrucomicrobiae bacterium]